VIEKAHGGCVLLENWVAPGQTGQSFNLYDRASKRWHQTWVNSGGGLHEYWGELKDGNMVFAGEIPLGPGSRFAGRRVVRLTFFPMGPDKVRQFSEALNMDGTWSVIARTCRYRRLPARSRLRSSTCRGCFMRGLVSPSTPIATSYGCEPRWSASASATST
jgi:hypothetical protein